MIRQSWNHIEFPEDSIKDLEKKIDEILDLYKEERQLLETIPGVKENSSASIIAEIGVNMGQFLTADNIIIMGRCFTWKQ